MSEYVDKEAAIRIAERYGLTNGSVLGRHSGIADCIANEISSLPAADVAEVHHAHWEEADWREYDAQSCETIRFPKATIVCSDCWNAFKKDALWEKNFCLNCGAEMSEVK